MKKSIILVLVLIMFGFVNLVDAQKLSTKYMYFDLNYQYTTVEGPNGPAIGHINHMLESFGSPHILTVRLVDGNGDVSIETLNFSSTDAFVTHGSGTSNPEYVSVTVVSIQFLLTDFYGEYYHFYYFGGSYSGTWSGSLHIPINVMVGDRIHQDL